MAYYSVIAPFILNGEENKQGLVLAEKINMDFLFSCEITDLVALEGLIEKYSDFYALGLEIVMTEDDNQEIYLEDCEDFD
jgi:hypothetical protein